MLCICYISAYALNWITSTALSFQIFSKQIFCSLPTYLWCHNSHLEVLESWHHGNKLKKNDAQHLCMVHIHINIHFHIEVAHIRCLVFFMVPRWNVLTWKIHLVTTHNTQHMCHALNARACVCILEERENNNRYNTLRWVGA